MIVMIQFVITLLDLIKIVLEKLDKLRDQAVTIKEKAVEKKRRRKAA